MTLKQKRFADEYIISKNATEAARKAGRGAYMEAYRKIADRFYHSKEWKACRTYYIEKRRLVDGGMCELCGQRLGHDVDHIKELDRESLSDPEIALNHQNLQYLCVPCHNLKGKSKDDRLVMFDEEGQPIIKDIVR